MERTASKLVRCRDKGSSVATNHCNDGASHVRAALDEYGHYSEERGLVTGVPPSHDPLDGTDASQM